MARATLKGFSLAEAVVVIGLLGLLVILAERVLIPSLRLQRKETALAQTQQRLQLAVSQIRECLQASGSGGLYYDQGILSCQSVHEVTTDAELSWETRPCLIGLDRARRELIRYDWKSSPTSVAGWTADAPLTLKPDDLLSLRQDRQHFQRLLATEIDDFAITHEGIGVRLGREIEIQLESKSADRVTRWSTHVSLRNSW
ncbi:hypothetical protein JST97_19860 [bacterium]|nr:hypothetical protein [bacterium]